MSNGCSSPCGPRRGAASRWSRSCWTSDGSETAVQTIRFRPRMSTLALLLAVQTALRADAVPPYLAFPEPGLDDPAAYEGYRTRFYRDARGNTVQIYIDQKSGRVVSLWADALNESLGFTVRDSAADTAAVAFGAGQATVGATGGRRWLRYSLTVQGGRSINIGLFLLGSMRVERDFQYAGRHKGRLAAASFVPDELV